MQGSLYLPLRGHAHQVAYTRGRLLVNAHHPEGHNLGLYCFPLDRWARKELSDEERASSGGLTQVLTDAPLAWLGSTAQGSLWWVDQSGGVGYETADAEFGEALKKCGQIGPKKDPVSMEGAVFCASDDRLLALTAQNSQWALWEVTRTGGNVQSQQVWCGDFMSEKGASESTESVHPVTAQYGPGVSGWGLSDGRVALWFEAGRAESWPPLFYL